MYHTRSHILNLPLEENCNRFMIFASIKCHFCLVCLKKTCSLKKNKDLHDGKGGREGDKEMTGKGIYKSHI